MATTFAARGDHGVAMMANTAAFQINIDLDADGERWRLVHQLGPVLVAAFANSPVGPRGGTGWQSHRLATWWAIDPSRTRPVDHVGDPGEAWLRYALDADVLLIRRHGDAVAVTESFSFQRWLHEGHPLGPPTVDDFDYHLSTLFPPVRPRGYLELRFLDVLGHPHWLVAAALVAGLVDTHCVAAALAATEPATGRWMDAARLGLGDESLASMAARRDGHRVWPGWSGPTPGPRSSRPFEHGGTVSWRGATPPRRVCSTGGCRPAPSPPGPRPVPRDAHRRLGHPPRPAKRAGGRPGQDAGVDRPERRRTARAALGVDVPAGVGHGPHRQLRRALVGPGPGRPARRGGARPPVRRLPERPSRPPVTTAARARRSEGLPAAGASGDARPPGLTRCHRHRRRPTTAPRRLRVRHGHPTRAHARRDHARHPPAHGSRLHTATGRRVSPRPGQDAGQGPRSAGRSRSREAFVGSGPTAGTSRGRSTTRLRLTTGRSGRSPSTSPR